MFLAVEMVPFERHLISGGNGRNAHTQIAIFSFNLFRGLIRFVLLVHRNLGLGNGLHSLQVQIAMRGIHLILISGWLYDTVL